VKSSNETGAALLTTLMIVAALSAISVSVLADIRRSGRISANATSIAQAQWYAIGAEAFARVTAEDLVSGALPRTSLAGPPQTATFPLDNGLMQVAVRDGSTCINLNSVVAGAGDIYERDETGASQLRTMMELQDIRGFTPEIVRKLRPWVCALPQVGPSRINLNALVPEQAPLLVAISEGRISAEQAKDLIRKRPQLGWQSIGEVFADPKMSALELPETVMPSFALETRFLAIDVLVTHGEAEVAMSELMMRSGAGFVTAARRWSEDT
jgi:general secretion pathway protein K